MEVNYKEGENQSAEDYSSLDDCLEKSVDVVRTAFEEYENPAIMWTGGKDSTLTMYVVHQVAEEYGYELPPAIFIDHFQHFDDLYTFVENWSDRFDIEVLMAENSDINSLVDKPNDTIHVQDLNEQNRNEVRNVLEYEEDTFPFLLDTEVGNHLLKTVPFHNIVEEHDFDAVFSGVRWDEQEARADETFFSPRQDSSMYPPHDRVQPILQYSEERVWDATWSLVVPEYVEGYPSGYVPESKDDLPNDVKLEDLPVSPKYFDGYRSLGSEVSTDKNSSEPAWLQDLDTEERAGRAQDKEGVMERLRDLGYM